jgi:hypothetical protein
MPGIGAGSFAGRDTGELTGLGTIDFIGSGKFRGPIESCAVG